MEEKLSGRSERTKSAWKEQNWGCSGAVDDIRDRTRHFCFDFFTDCPAHKVFEPMAKLFPRLTFKIHTHVDVDYGIDVGPRSYWRLAGGEVVAVHWSTDLDGEIRERIRPDMTGQEKRQLAEWCASQKSLFSVDEWFYEIKRVIRESSPPAEEEDAA